MNSIKLALVVAFTTLFIIACNSTTQNSGNNTSSGATPTTAATPKATATPPADEFASVRPIYAAECARCHQAGGEGGTVEVLKKKLKVPSLATGHALNHTDEQLARKIAKGDDGMPAFEDKLKKEEIEALVRLIRKEFQTKGAAKDKGEKAQH
jgi:mono/diheme cytochrome c family protein